MDATLYLWFTSLSWAQLHHRLCLTRQMKGELWSCLPLCSPVFFLHGNMQLLLSESTLRLPNRTLKDGFHYRILLHTSFGVDTFWSEAFRNLCDIRGDGINVRLARASWNGWGREEGVGELWPSFLSATFPCHREASGITLTEESRGQTWTTTIFHPLSDVPRASWT